MFFIHNLSYFVYIYIIYSSVSLCYFVLFCFLDFCFVLFVVFVLFFLFLFFLFYFNYRSFSVFFLLLILFTHLPYIVCNFKHVCQYLYKLNLVPYGEVLYRICLLPQPIMSLHIIKYIYYNVSY